MLLFFLELLHFNPSIHYRHCSVLSVCILPLELGMGRKGVKVNRLTVRLTLDLRE